MRLIIAIHQRAELFAGVLTVAATASNFRRESRAKVSPSQEPGRGGRELANLPASLLTLTGAEQRNSIEGRVPCPALVCFFRGTDPRRYLSADEIAVGDSGDTPDREREKEQREEQMPEDVRISR